MVMDRQHRDTIIPIYVTALSAVDSTLTSTSLMFGEVS